MSAFRSLSSDNSEQKSKESVCQLSFPEDFEDDKIDVDKLVLFLTSRRKCRTKSKRRPRLDLLREVDLEHTTDEIQVFESWRAKPVDVQHEDAPNKLKFLTSQTKVSL